MARCCSATSVTLSHYATPTAALDALCKEVYGKPWVAVVGAPATVTFPRGKELRVHLPAAAQTDWTRALPLAHGHLERRHSPPMVLFGGVVDHARAAGVRLTLTYA